MKASRARALASRCQLSPGILATSERLPCTTSSWLIGSTKFSLHAYTVENVISLWWYCRWIGSCDRYDERVVHPAHVPLEAEAQPAAVGRPGDAGPGGRLLGHHHHARVVLVDGRVQLLQERDRLQVLPAAVLVRRPLAVLAGVVQVEHRGDRVDPQPVDVELLAPVERVGDEEVAHLGPAEVEDVRAPVGVLAAPRVGVLVQRRAVEAGQRPLVAREVRRHPVQDHADAGLVQACRRGGGTRPGRRTGRSARSSRSPGSPTSRRTGAPSPA